MASQPFEMSGVNKLDNIVRDESLLLEMRGVDDQASPFVRGEGHFSQGEIGGGFSFAIDFPQGNMRNGFSHAIRAVTPCWQFLKALF